jgi:hypothetical protein
MALFGVGALVVVAFSTFVATFFTVEQRTTAIVQRRTNAILIPHSPGNLATLTEQMRNSVIEADQTSRPARSLRSI